MSGDGQGIVGKIVSELKDIRDRHLKDEEMMGAWEARTQRTRLRGRRGPRPRARARDGGAHFTLRPREAQTTSRPRPIRVCAARALPAHLPSRPRPAFPHADVHPFIHLDKAAVLQDCRVFHDAGFVRMHPKRCCQLLTKLLWFLSQGETLGQAESTEVFFGVTKLFQSPDGNLRRMVYLFLKEVRKGEGERRRD
jgi:hypothetical protein